MKVLICDDHKIVRLGVAAAFGQAFPNVAVTEAGSSAELFQRFRSDSFDLIVLDVQMPDYNALETITQLLMRKPLQKIAVLSVKEETIYAARFLKAGAMGYLEKGVDVTTLKHAVTTILGGHVYMSPQVATVVTKLAISGQDSQNPFQKLTNRELEILTYFRDGLKSSQICALLHLQPSTITTYKRRIFEKLNVENMYQLNRITSEYHL